MPDDLAKVRMRRYRERQRRGERVVRIAVPDDVAEAAEPILDRPEVQELVATLLAALCVTRNYIDIQDAVHSALTELLDRTQ